jgi:hypothetical protein
MERPRVTIGGVSRLHVCEISESDKVGVALLLAAEFRGSTKNIWLEILERLAKHKTPAGLPKYGYLMKSEEGSVVGAILTISSVVRSQNASTVRCNLSCWCVAPTYRLLAHLFIRRILNKNNDVTYINISPAPYTLQLIQMQGFSCYCQGAFYAFTIPLAFHNPLASSHHVQVEIFSTGVSPGSHFEAFEYDLLQEHAQNGCLSLWCVTPDRAHPFVFRSRLLRGFIPYVHLIYCRSIDEFVRFANPIGRFLARRRELFVMIDANGRIPDLFGVYRGGSNHRFFRGAAPPRLGDLAYTELALFGL